MWFRLLATTLVLFLLVFFTARSHFKSNSKAGRASLDEEDDALKIAALIDHGRYMHGLNPVLSDDIINEVFLEQPTLS